MLICTLQNLDQDEIDEINGDQGTPTGKLAQVLCNGAEVAVLSIECDSGNNPESKYYNVVFANGARLEGISGYHLKGIAAWR